MLEKIVYINQENIKNCITSVYLEAFPINERPPVDYFFATLARKENTLLAFYDEGIFIGFAYLTHYLDICYIFFLAVQKEKRDQGYGGQILEFIKKDNAHYSVLLCYEEVNPLYPDYENRLKRQKFYFSHGFIDNGLKTNEYGVIFQTAYFGHRKINFLEYQEIFKLGFGKGSEKYLKEAK